MTHLTGYYSMNADTLVKEIFTIVNTLSEQDMSSLSGDTLSRLAVKLASYKASLGEHVAQAERLALDAEAEYKLARAKEYQKLRDGGKGSTDSDELKAIGSHDSYLAWNKAKQQSVLIKTLNQNCHDLIDGIKSRLINLQSERGAQNVY